jgi:DNA-binding MarR family transcriptional regulator
VTDHPGLGYGEIALAMSIDRTNTADVCMRLAEKGVLALHPSPTDKRKKCVFMSKRGEALMTSFAKRVDVSQQRLLEPLSKAEQKIFLNLLNRIVEHGNDLSRAPYVAP